MSDSGKVVVSVLATFMLFVFLMVVVLHDNDIQTKKMELERAIELAKLSCGEKK